MSRNFKPTANLVHIFLIWISYSPSILVQVLKLRLLIHEPCYRKGWLNWCRRIVRMRWKISTKWMMAKVWRHVSIWREPVWHTLCIVWRAGRVIHIDLTMISSDVMLGNYMLYRRYKKWYRWYRWIRHATGRRVPLAGTGQICNVEEEQRVEKFRRDCENYSKFGIICSN
jgi:hypothetical protein